MFKVDKGNDIIKKRRKYNNSFPVLSSTACSLTFPGVQGTNTHLKFWALQFPEKLIAIVNARNTRNILKAITNDRTSHKAERLLSFLNAAWSARFNLSAIESRMILL